MSFFKFDTSADDLVPDTHFIVLKQVPLSRIYESRFFHNL